MRASNEHGLTLAEVMSAMAILGIAVVLFLNLSGYSSLAAQRSIHAAELRYAAQSELHAAREQIARTGSVPEHQAAPSYTVIYSMNDTAVEQTRETQLQHEAFTLQAVILFDGRPQWLTVTVVQSK